MGNLSLPTIASGQNQKYQTSNDADNALDLALTDLLTVDLSAGNVALTSAQFVAAIAFVSSGNTVARTLTVQPQRRLFTVKNGGTALLSIACGTTSLTLIPGASGLFYTDGTANGLARVSGSAQDIPAFFRGVPGSSALVLRFVATRALTIPADAVGSQASAGTAATASATFTVSKNGSAVGSIAWSASGTVGAFTMASAVALAAGDVLTITAPASADATLADIAITLAATA
jgi:hypothetical protein